MDFIKIPFCACSNDRCKKKSPPIGSYANQSVQTDIRFGFDRKKTFTSVELGKGEVSAKHSISTSMEVGSIVSGRLKTSFHSKSHELYPPSIPIIKEVGDAKERSSKQMGQDFDSEYLPSADIQEPVLYSNFVEEQPVEKDEPYSEDQDLPMLDEEQQNLGAKADSRADSTYDMAEAREELRYDLEEAREEAAHDVEKTREEEAIYDLKETRVESTYDREDAREESSYDLEETREESTYDMEHAREESTYNMKDIKENGPAAIMESPLAASDKELDVMHEVSNNDRTQEVPTTPLPVNSITVEPIEQVAETEDFSESKDSDSELKETRPKPKGKRSVRPVRSGLRDTPKPKKPKVYQPTVRQPRKRLTPPKRNADAKGMKLRTLPSIMLPRKHSFPVWPIATPVCRTIQCCTNDFLWTPRITNSVCSPSIRLVPSRVSHSSQCDFGSHQVNPCDRTGCGGDIQQYCDKFCKSTNDIGCYRLQALPNNNHLSQSCDALPKPLETCNLYRMQVCNPSQMQPRLQPCQYQSSRSKNCQNTSNYRKPLHHGCGNVHFRKYRCCNNLRGMFTPYRMCCSYRHTMIHPSMYLYTFAI